MKITFGSSLHQNTSGFTIIIPLQEGYDKIAFGTLLSSYKVSGVEEILNMTEGKEGESQILFSDNEAISRIAIIGVGVDNIISRTKSIFTKVSAQNKSSFVTNLGFDLSLLKLENDGSATFIEQSVCGIIIGMADIALYKTDKKDRVDLDSIHIFSQEQELRESVLIGIEKGKTISSIINLVNAPSNHKTTEHLTSWLRTSSNLNGYQLQVLEKDELEKLGFHALLAVNRGSEIPAKCLIATYKPPTKDKLPNVTIVGKGVTFDTGGLSIKKPTNMHYMKSDMGGAAAVMGTIELASKLKLAINLRVIVPTTDNSVDALSIKPGDVISSYSGKTIEVIDTDAEGRLILADALSYAIKNNSPDYLVDLATLTGSVVAALGPEAAGIMSHNNDLVTQLTEAGNKIGEKLWRLPLWKEYASYMESDIADIKNLGSKPMAGAITAGKFLEAFVEEHPAWAHLDIAGTAFGSTPMTKSYGATGFGIDLLINWLTTLSKA